MRNKIIREMFVLSCAVVLQSSPCCGKNTAFPVQKDVVQDTAWIQVLSPNSAADSFSVAAQGCTLGVSMEYNEIFKQSEQTMQVFLFIDQGLRQISLSPLQYNNPKQFIIDLDSAWSKNPRFLLKPKMKAWGGDSISIYTSGAYIRAEGYWDPNHSDQSDEMFRIIDPDAGVFSQSIDDRQGLRAITHHGRDHIEIKGTGSGVFAFSLFDMRGVLVKAGKSAGAYVSVGALHGGVYMLRIMFGEEKEATLPILLK